MIIRFQKLFPYAPYLNEEQDISMDFPDTTDQATYDSYMDTLRTLQENNHKRQYPHLYTNTEGDKAGSWNNYDGPVNDTGLRNTHVQKTSAVEHVIDQINECVAISEKNKWGQEIGLLAYEGPASQNEEIKAAYDKRLKELS